MLLELVIRAFQDGATPEVIVQRYATLTLSDVYSVIAFYLRHTDEVEAYLATRERQAETTRERIEGSQGDLTQSARDCFLVTRHEGPWMLRLLADENLNADIVTRTVAATIRHRRRQRPGCRDFGR